MNAAPDSRRLLSDMVVASPVLSEDRGDRDQAMADITNNAGPSGASDFDEYGGVDPNLDPELAMVSLQNQSDTLIKRYLILYLQVLRMSLEEERARRAREGAAAAGSSTSKPSDEPPAAASSASTSTPAPSQPQQPQTSLIDSEMDPDEEAALDRKSTRLNSSHSGEARMPSSA